MNPNLELHEKYKRNDVAKAFGEEHGRGGKWMSGVVPVGDNSLALFITLDKSGYSGESRYKDAFESKKIIRWQSQTRASPDNAWGKKHINGGPDKKPHYLFVRTKKGKKFTFCGQVKYLRHKDSKPMTVWWKLIVPISGHLLEKFEEATDHAGGLEKPDYVKSKDMDLKPPAPDLRKVVQQDKSKIHKGFSPFKIEKPPWGWASNLNDFLSAERSTILKSLKDHHKRRFEDLPLGKSQINAWKKTIDIFKEKLSDIDNIESLKDMLITLEYELPGEGGRRPDVILVTHSKDIFVIECKNKDSLTMADLDQSLRYKKDLEEYHSETHDRSINAFLALLKAPRYKMEIEKDNPVSVITTSEEGFDKLLSELENSSNKPSSYEPEMWLNGEYAPLPHLIEAMIATFEDKDLPRIRHVRSTNVPDTIEEVKNLIIKAEEKKQHFLVLVTGAPGSGKTLVGIKSTIIAWERDIDSLYLSGNGPLVAVLQDAFDRAGAKGAAKSVLKPMYKFKQEVTKNQTVAPGHVYVFDEGQRAWDKKKNKKYSGSEIELLAEVSNRNNWGVVVGLIGEGQEIYKGEDGGLNTWVKEFENLDKKVENWTIVLPEENVIDESTFDNIVHKDILHLEDNIRAKAAHQLHEWVESVINGKEDVASDISFNLQNNGYPIHVTKSRKNAEYYVNKLYEEEADPRYGWVISSDHRKGRDPEGMKAPFVRPQQLKQIWGPWYNAPSDDPASCCQLEKPCSEFGCQGLELDFVLLFWGNDLKRRGDDWEIPGNVRKWSDEPKKHTLNAYRVLLTRGREGTVIRCTDEETFEYLQRCGATLIEE